MTYQKIKELSKSIYNRQSNRVTKIQKIYSTNKIIPVYLESFKKYPQSNFIYQCVSQTFTKTEFQNTG